MKNSNFKTQKEVIRVAGKLREIISIKDEKGNLLHKIISPLMVEVHARDVVQVIVGAAILAVPVGFTEEVWNLGSSLPISRIYALSALSLLFIAVFVYYNFYREHLEGHVFQFIKRVLIIYILSFIVVALFLAFIQVAPWQEDFLLAFKRTVLVAFPASMSAAVADMIK